MNQSVGDWSKYLSKEKEKDYFISLYSFLNSR
ncbi:MAG: uracil-DNA glycosylase, partial [Thiotrichales bacterium]|nr:uracil-DNA glycosylase [Thiotrichales bacterium]MBT3854231.1 uracil-DNA glycosylase [Thiotrichales bacterium]MBT5499645.1 uracil-DNA glycosylase [Thiotrichales bacterium]